MNKERCVKQKSSQHIYKGYPGRETFEIASLGCCIDQTQIRPSKSHTRVVSINVSTAKRIGPEVGLTSLFCWITFSFLLIRYRSDINQVSYRTRLLQTFTHDQHVGADVPHTLIYIGQVVVGLHWKVSQISEIKSFIKNQLTL